MTQKEERVQLTKVAGVLNGLIPDHPTALVQYFKVQKTQHMTIVATDTFDNVPWQINFNDRDTALTLKDEDIPKWCQDFMTRHDNRAEQYKEVI